MPKTTHPRPSRPAARLALSVIVAAMLLSACEQQQHDVAATAREYFAKGDYVAASLYLKSAVQAKPDNAALRVLLADTQERLHDLAGAQDQLSKAADGNGDPNQLVPRIAMLMLERNEFVAIVRQYQGTTLSDPAADAQLRGVVALALLARHRADAARAHLPTSPSTAATVKLARAQLVVLDGKPRDALALLDVEGDAGKNAPFYVLRAAKRIAQAAGEPARALDYMKRAAEAAPWNAGVMGEFGEALVTAGRFDDAQRVLDGLRKKHNGLFWTQYLHALLAHRAGRFEEAHAAVLRALNVAPENPSAQVLAASTEIQNGDLMVAERRLQAVLKKDARSVTGWQLYAMAQARLNRPPKEQLESLQRGLQLAPKDPILLGLLADVQLATGQQRAALATLNALLAARPDDVDAKLKVARTRHAAGDKAGALALLEQAAAAATEARQSATAVALAIELGSVPLAHRIAEQAVARHPADPMARLAVAGVQAAQNNRAGAWATTLAVLDKHPAHAGALTALVTSMRQPAERAEVLTRYQAAVDASAREPQVYLDYVRLLSRVPPPRPIEPVAVLERGVQAAPESIMLRETLIEALLVAGQPDKAVTVAETGAAMNNAPPASGALLATLLDRLGRRESAAAAWRKVAAANPQRSDWRLAAARVEADSGQAAVAGKQLQTLIDERPFDAEPYVMLATLQAKDDLGRALDTARRLGAQPGQAARADLLAGDLLVGANRIDEALALFEKAAKAGAGAEGTLRVVRTHDRAGRRDAADRELAEALKKDPHDAALGGEAARRAMARDDAGRAVEILQRLAAREPGNPYLANDLAWAQLTAGRPEALASARRAAAMLPNNPLVLHTLGMALARAGQPKEAVHALRAAANLAPQAALPRLHLAQQLVASGDKVAATQALRSVDASQLSAADKNSLGKLKADLGMS